MGDHKFLTGFTWYKIVWQKHTFKVQEMKKDNFIDFALWLQATKADGHGKKFVWKNIRWICYENTRYIFLQK